ncbi:ABC transporter transmembrane domain-containing protein [Pseudosulfitobacter sp. SM2401]|uniref:ABC transporter transmembrane domain-containing protein n=1 Tax=Pseudosulfitobacter sp. SM2401 TaxID=3350098 RepID=UPI0036F24CBE
MLLVVTLTLFPLLYLTLELPKRIINDAIGAGADQVTVYGYQMGQITFLMVLCGLFLLAVFAHGIMKMRINTMKGVLAERLLRRFRYTLIARILRFPAPYFERTSQGELVSMVTSESEPMGGLMGDAVAQPVLQAGQMLTILGFLFFQSFAFGIAACALIPLQAWIIPKMQKQINQLNKKRVVQIRALAAEIGEGAAGASALRTNGGWRYRMAMISDRLGRLYAIRFEIFQKKFFMKFTNNFITQLTPFFFFSLGGYLAIKGEITVGALVAALAAYKDLSSPWKELLAYYNQSQDMSLRWDTITERFAPTGMIDTTLFDTDPGEIPALIGDITLSGISVRDEEGNSVLEDLNVAFPAASTIAITAPSDEDRRALAELLTREVMPSSGTLSIAGQDITKMHQATIATRIGHATSRPVMFMGSFGDNVMMPLKFQPIDPPAATDGHQETLRAGNSSDMLEAEWLNPQGAGVDDPAQLSDWWLQLITGMGSGDALFRRGLDQKFDPNTHPELAARLVDLRPRVTAALDAAGLSQHAWRFNPSEYNPALPVADNLLYATPRTPITADVLATQTDFMDLLASLNLEDDLLQLAVDTVDMLRQIFGSDGTDHPLFRKLGFEVTAYEDASALITKFRDAKTLDTREKAQLLAVPFVISAEKIGPAFPDEIVARVLDMRREHGPALQASMKDLFTPLVDDQPVAGLSVMENALFGKVSDGSGSRGDDLRRTVADVLQDADLNGLVLALIFDLPIPRGGANVPAMFAEPLAVSRATIKRPHVLILDSVLSSYDAQAQSNIHANLRAVLPETTIICLAPSFADITSFDLHFEMKQGRLSTDDAQIDDAADSTVSADLARKLRAIEQTDLFSGLDRKQLRLLAFGARWYSAEPGDYVFHKNDDPTDGAYLVIQGEADLLLPKKDGDDTLIATSGPGKLIGELGLIRNEPRALDMRAKTDLTCLRIGAEEFLAVVENDASTAYKLLQVVAGYVSN